VPLPTVAANSDITVVIPCFDYGRYVTEAVRSALEQEGGPPSVVVVDDGSTDPGTLEVLDSLPPGVQLVRRPNGGPAAARNTGAAESDTPLILMLDADDKLSPRALRLLRGALEADPEAGFSYGLMQYFGDWSGVVRFPDYDPYRLLHRPIISATSLIRRDLYEMVGGFDPQVEGFEDWDFYLGALEHGRTGRRVDEVVLLYRRHGASKVDSDRSSYRRSFRAVRRKHAALYARRRSLAAQSALGLPGRLVYRTYFAWRPLPARIERAIYARLFR
jgi:glycosyltransferase involved in cell wall biosynthesis